MSARKKDKIFNNKLDRVSTRRLENLLIENSESICNGEWTKAEFAEYATKILERPVTKGNVEGASKALAGEVELNWTKGATNNNPNVYTLHSNQRFLAKLMWQLCDALEYEWPERLERIANGDVSSSNSDS